MTRSRITIVMVLSASSEKARSLKENDGQETQDGMIIRTVEGGDRLYVVLCTPGITDEQIVLHVADAVRSGSLDYKQEPEPDLVENAAEMNQGDQDQEDEVFF